MKYQIVINSTKYHDSYSHNDINDIFIKYFDTGNISHHLFEKCLCYAIILITSEPLKRELNFIGEHLIITNDNIDTILQSYELSIQTIQSIKSKNNYIFPYLVGGLGNRLFQLVAIFNVANKNDKKFIISTSHKINKHNPHSDKDYNNTIFKQIQKSEIIPKIHYDKIKKKYFSFRELPLFDDNTCYEGFFQNELYVKSIKEHFFNIINIEKPKYTLSNSIFIHVRLTDYKSSKFDVGLLDNDYYNKALQLFDEKNISIDTIYIISDDIPLATRILNINHKNIIFYDKDELETLQMMISCEYGGICSNSSFSWWGGYLNDHPQKIIIFPKRWMKNLNDCDIQFSGSIII